MNTAPLSPLYVPLMLRVLEYLAQQNRAPFGLGQAAAAAAAGGPRFDHTQCPKNASKEGQSWLTTGTGYLGQEAHLLT